MYACESWTLTAELQRKIQAMEMRHYRKILHISYKDHVTNEEIGANIQQTIEPLEDLLRIVKRRKLQWYSHVSRSSGLAKVIWQGTVKGGRRKADRGRGGRTTSGNGQGWSWASPSGQWRTGKKKKKEETKEKTGCKIICGAPTTLAVKELVMMMIMIKHFSEPSIFLDKNLIKVVTKAKFLNVVFDRTLSYNSHVNYLKTNCLKARDI